MFKRFLSIIIYLGIVLLSLMGQSVSAEVATSTGKNAFLATEESEFLSPDQAFKLELQAIDSQHIQAKFSVVDGYYLYKERIKFVINDAHQGKITEISLPVGDIKDDPNFGKSEVYHHDFIANIQVQPAISNLNIIAKYQGCSSKGLCYAPQQQSFNIVLPASTNINNPDTAPSNTATQNGGNNLSLEKTTQALQSGNLGLVIIGFFAAGLLLSLTPCVLPMIPILSSIIVGSQSRKTTPDKLHAFMLSVAYVLGMALSYSIAGVAAGLSGNLLSQSLQNAWVLAATALLFVALACSMFGFYELKLPTVFENKILNASNKLKGGAFLGVFIMGALSALIVSPCVAAPLAGALIYIGQTHNVFLGGVGLFVLAIGMGVPLLLIGASAGSLVPKAGAWMTVIRNFFGILMLLMAAYIAWPVLPHKITQPVNQLLGFNVERHLPFQRIKSVNELNAQIIAAKGKLVMLDFYADWCVACKEMERYTFSNTQVQALLKDAVLLQADVTENNTDDQALLKRFDLFGPPAILFFDSNGQELAHLKVVGYKNGQDFFAIIKQAKSQ